MLRSTTTTSISMPQTAQHQAASSAKQDSSINIRAHQNHIWAEQIQVMNALVQVFNQHQSYVHAAMVHQRKHA